MKYIDDFLKKYPSFIITDIQNDKITMQGEYEVNSKYKNIHIYKKVFLKIIFFTSYPIRLPEVYDVKNILSKDYHINSDGSLCLSTQLEIRKTLYQDSSLINWIESFVNPFIFSSEVFKKYHILIFGEREHDIIGEINSIRDFISLFSTHETYVFLKFFLLRKFRRNFFKNKTKINKYRCFYCNTIIPHCSHFLRLKELNMYFNNNLITYISDILLQYEKEMNTYH